MSAAQRRSSHGEEDQPLELVSGRRHWGVRDRILFGVAPKGLTSTAHTITYLI